MAQVRNGVSSTPKEKIVTFTRNMANKKQPVPFDFKPLYASRMLFMLETRPQSGKFVQVRLNKKQFDAISRAMYVQLSESNQYGSLIALHVSDEQSPLPDTFQDYYEHPEK